MDRAMVVLEFSQSGQKHQQISSSHLWMQTLGNQSESKTFRSHFMIWIKQKTVDSRRKSLLVVLVRCTPRQILNWRTVNQASATASLQPRKGQEKTTHQLQTTSPKLKQPAQSHTSFIHEPQSASVHRLVARERIQDPFSSVLNLKLLVVQAMLRSGVLSDIVVTGL